MQGLDGVVGDGRFFLYGDFLHATLPQDDGVLAAAPDEGVPLHRHAVQDGLALPHAVADNEVTGDGHVLQCHTVHIDDHIPLWDLRHHAGLPDVEGEGVIHHLGELCPGDGSGRLQPAAVAAYIARLHHGGHRADGPGRHIGPVLKGIQILHGSVFQAQGPGQGGKGLLPGDRAVGLHQGAGSGKHSHAHRLGQAVIVPGAGLYVGIAGQVSGAGRAIGPDEDGGQFRPCKGPMCVDPALPVTHQQAVVHRRL